MQEPASFTYVVRSLLTGVFFLPFLYAAYIGLVCIVRGPRIPALTVAAVVIAILWVGRRFGKSRRPGLSRRLELLVALIVLEFGLRSMIWASPGFAYPIELLDGGYGWCRAPAAVMAELSTLLCSLSGLCFMLDAILGSFAPSGNDERLQPNLGG